MIAAVYHAPGDVRVEDMPEPGEPLGSDVVLEVSRASICGTDASEFAHAPKFFPIAAPHPFSGHQGPTIMGHEFTGRVAALGPDAAGFGIGDRVVCGAGVSCGTCEWCVRGRTNLCASYYTLGLHSHGGLAPYVRTPASLCRSVPETCSDDAAAMAQPLAVALHALRRSGARPGQSIAVIGAGGIGSFLIGAAAASGAGDLIAVDIDESRLAAARALGASHTVHAGREDAVEAIRAVTGAGADVVLEASGAPRSPGVAVAAAKRGGTVLIVGLQAEPVALDLFSATIREVDLKTTLAHVCDEDLTAAVEMLDTTEFAHAAFGGLIALSEIVPRGLVPLADGSASGKLVVDVRA
ncbi:MAG: (R,R)-butanediol dehydrogenase / meso-butanediol dehydrogenase / diacetyl reductase [Gaiellales bacterium]|nr:(R,R)-butanediol dehydrogenase / meso-butanediol dehydrogenase / diacetyl reductase [Gaiellales bacterium]